MSPRVVYLCASTGADVGHLTRVADDVELIVYRSRWLPSGVASSELPAMIRTRSFQPLVRARRGHLAYLYRGLRAALDVDRPDVIHVVSEPWGLLALQAASWVRRNPGSSLVLHGCDTIWHHGRTLKRVGRRAILRRTLPMTDAFVAESRKALDVAATSGLPARSIRAAIHTNPRDAELFGPPTADQRTAARRAFGLADGETAVGLLGRLVPEKGVGLLLDAADLLSAEGFAGRFMFAGGGPAAGAVAERDNPAVQLVGSLSHPHGVIEFFRALDVIACPSLTTSTWEDQGPRALLEAMMCGCVPVGTPTGAIAEMLPANGVLAAGTTAADVAAAVERAAETARDATARARISADTTAVYSADAVADALVGLWTAVSRGAAIEENQP